MEPPADREKFITTRRAAAAVFVLVLTVTAVFLARHSQGQEQSENVPAAGLSTAATSHSLQDASLAGFISVFVYDEAGQVSSIMVGSGTAEFDSFASALQAAKPVEAVTDDTFNILLVVSFGRNQTMDVSYSPARNILIEGEQAYQPQVDLNPLISQVRHKFE
jgi:hypothetical protein